MNPNWTQFGSTYTYTPSGQGQVYLAHSLGAVPSNATRVGVIIVQEGDIETFVELHKGYSTAIYEFNQTAVLAKWLDDNTVGISYARFANTNKLTVKVYYK